MELRNFARIAPLIIAFAFATTASANTHSKHHVAKKVHKAPVPKKPSPIAALRPFAGSWFLLDAKQHEVRTTKIVLDAFGHFAFTGSEWKSEGNYAVKDNAIELVWTKVDGAAVKPDSMRKIYALNQDRNMFQIDKFTYGKHGSVFSTTK